VLADAAGRHIRNVRTPVVTSCDTVPWALT
jgi:hypothetical protein